MQSGVSPAGPRLPPNGVPRRVSLPAAERFQHDGSLLRVMGEDGLTFDYGEVVQSKAEIKTPAVQEAAEDSVEEDNATQGTGPSEGSVSEEIEDEEEEEEELEQKKELEPELIETKRKLCPLCHDHARGVDWPYTCPDEKETQAGMSFYHLLREISVEHRREIARVRQAAAAALNEAKAQAREQTPPKAQHQWVTQTTLSIPQFDRQSSPCSNANFLSLPIQDLPFDTTKSQRLSPFDFVDGSETEQPPKKVAIELRRKLLHLLGWQGPRHYQKNQENWCKKIVRCQAFDFVCGLLIILNSVLQGWVANHSVSNATNGVPLEELPVEFQVITFGFTTIFLVELLIRLYASDLRACITCKDDSWVFNCLDTVVVCSDVIHSVVDLLVARFISGSNSSENFTLLRMLRVFRITRALRVVRLFRFFRELRMMMYSVLRSGSSLLWSCVLLLFTIYAFAVYFIQITAYAVSSNGSGTALTVTDLEELRERFGNLARAEYSLYLAVSGGISWGELSGLFLKIHEVHAVVFCAFVFFTSFAVLNIITGIFVESAMNSARSNQEEVVQEQMHATAGLLEEMKKIFQSADVNGDGCISFKEFEAYLDRKEVRAYLDALGVGMEKAKGLFELLDLDGSGEITIEEFAFGCLRLKGSAKSIDLATLMNHSRRMAEQFRRFFKWSEDQFKQLHDFQTRVDEHLLGEFGFDSNEQPPGFAAPNINEADSADRERSQTSGRSTIRTRLSTG